MEVELDKATNQVIEISLNGVEIFSIISSVFSLVLGIVAIWLSVLFYKMSSKSSKEIEKSSSAIDSNVKRLEVLFDKMYTDTFGMVKDTVSDMRQYVYKSNGKEEQGTEAIAVEIEKKTKDIVNEAINELQEDKLSKHDIEILVNKIIKESTNVAKKYESNSIIERVKFLLQKHRGITFPELQKKMLIKEKSSILFDALVEMAEQGIIEDPFEFDEEGNKIIYHNTKIYLN